MTIQEFYGGFYQQPLLLAVPTLVWIFALGAMLRPRDFVWKYCLVFALLSVVDAFLTANDVLGTGPWVGVMGTIVPISFVILGDFRVYFWLYRKRWPVALALSLIVPVVSYLLRFVLPDLWTENLRVVFLIYELLFLGVFTVVSIATAGVRSLADPFRAYPLAYYAAWAAADVWLLLSNHDAVGAWGLRILANLMYYVGWTPWVWRTARAGRRSGL